VYNWVGLFAFVRTALTILVDYVAIGLRGLFLGCFAWSVGYYGSRNILDPSGLPLLYRNIFVFMISKMMA
jgi:hypothetical protein